MQVDVVRRSFFASDLLSLGFDNYMIRMASGAVSIKILS